MLQSVIVGIIFLAAFIYLAKFVYKQTKVGKDGAKCDKCLPKEDKLK